MDAEGEITPQHYAFLISEPEFDEIFGRIRDHQPGDKVAITAKRGSNTVHVTATLGKQLPAFATVSLGDSPNNAR